MGKGPQVVVLTGPPGAIIVAEALESAQVLDARVTCALNGRGELRVNILGERARVLFWSPQARGVIVVTSVVE